MFPHDTELVLHIHFSCRLSVIIQKNRGFKHVWLQPSFPKEHRENKGRDYCLKTWKWRSRRLCSAHLNTSSVFLLTGGNVQDTCGGHGWLTGESVLTSQSRVSTPRTGGTQRHLMSLFLTTANKPSPTAAVIAAATPTSTNATASIFFLGFWLLVRKGQKAEKGGPSLLESRKIWNLAARSHTVLTRNHRLDAPAVFQLHWGGQDAVVLPLFNPFSAVFLIQV